MSGKINRVLWSVRQHRSHKPLRRFLLAAVGGMLAAAVLIGLFEGLWSALGAMDYSESSSAVLLERKPPSDRKETMESSPAMAYAQAVRNGDADRVVTMVAWMQERLAWVRNHPEAHRDIEQEKKVLAEAALNRDPSGNVLREEGCEDAYIFTAGCSLRWLRNDPGMASLDGVARRDWIEVTYPAKNLALFDKAGRPIHSLVVGINLTADHKVLKAAVTGNLEIDYDRIVCDWP